jgi:hypothetical protein
MVIHTCNPGTWEAEAGEFQTRLYSKTLTQKPREGGKEKRPKEERQRKREHTKQRLTKKKRNNKAKRKYQSIY